MPSAPMPRAARAAIVVAFLLAFVSGLSVRSGPIMLLGICFAALYSAVSMLRRRAWGAYGFAFLLLLSVVAVLVFAITGQSSGGFIQVSIGLIIYLGIAGLFLLAGHALAVAGGPRGSALPWLIIALLFSAPFLFLRPVSIASAAMENTLLTGDFILANRHRSDVQQGELIAFHYPLDPAQIFVRRVAGVPGDRVRFANGKLVRNGAAIAEPYVTHALAPTGGLAGFPLNIDPASLQSRGRDMLRQNLASGEIVVPAHEFFVLGDARSISFDSRQWGFVPESAIIGHPQLIYDSLEPDSAGENPKGPERAPSHRWNRVFKPL